MTTYSTKSLLFGLFLLLFQSVLAQEDLIVFWQPEVRINYRVGNDYSHYFSVSNRNLLYQDESEFRVRHLDLNHFSTFNLRDNQSLSMGLLWRHNKIFDDELPNEIRLTEQYNINTRLDVIRFGYRFRAEQRFFSEKNLYRFRNRFAVDYPLQGKSLDIKESYMLWSIENVIRVARSDSPLYELRLRGGIGWQISPKSKMQFVIQYRFSDFTNRTFHVLLLETTLNLGI